MRDGQPMAAVFGSKVPSRPALLSADTSRPLAAGQFPKPTDDWDLEARTSSRDALPSGRCTNRCTTHQGLDHDHRHSAAPTHEGRQDRPDGRCLSVGLGRVPGCIGGQQFPNTRQILATPGIGQQPVMADAVKPGRQHVQQEAAHELRGRERHRLVTGSSRGAIVLPAKRHPAFIQ